MLSFIFQWWLVFMGQIALASEYHSTTASET